MFGISVKRHKTVVTKSASELIKEQLVYRRGTGNVTYNNLQLSSNNNP